MTTFQDTHFTDTTVRPADRSDADRLRGLRDVSRSLHLLLESANETPPARGKRLPDALAGRITNHFGMLVRALHGTADVEGDEQHTSACRQVQQEILPWMRQSELGERMYAKPRGYAGDFETIDAMYRDTPSGTTPVGVVLDQALRAQSACLAVVNRRRLLAEEIGEALRSNAPGTARVTSLACGPAAELFDVFETIGDTRRLDATCVDIDADALALVEERGRARRLGEQIALRQANLVHLALGRRSFEILPQDLVYSIGLIDYFSDRFVVRLLDWIHEILKPGGRVILGNFHPDNPTRMLMEQVFDWRLIHRTEADMDRLFEASRFGSRSADIRFESERVNLFAMGRRR